MSYNGPKLPPECTHESLHLESAWSVHPEGINTPKHPKFSNAKPQSQKSISQTITRPSGTGAVDDIRDRHSRLENHWADNLLLFVRMMGLGCGVLVFIPMDPSWYVGWVGRNVSSHIHFIAIYCLYVRLSLQSIGCFGSCMV
jgi:hypothetical protein